MDIARDLPAPSATTQVALDQALSQLEYGQRSCEVATTPNADAATARLARHDATNDFPEGLAGVRDALRRGGIPV